MLDDASILLPNGHSEEVNHGLSEANLTWMDYAPDRYEEELKRKAADIRIRFGHHLASEPPHLGLLDGLDQAVLHQHLQNLLISVEGARMPALLRVGLRQTQQLGSTGGSTSTCR